MTEGERNANAAEVAAALVEVALELGGAWVVEISPSGQLRLAPAPEDS